MVCGKSCVRNFVACCCFLGCVLYCCYFFPFRLLFSCFSVCVVHVLRRPSSSRWNEVLSGVNSFHMRDFTGFAVSRTSSPVIHKIWCWNRDLDRKSFVPPPGTLVAQSIHCELPSWNGNTHTPKTRCFYNSSSGSARVGWWVERYF